MKWMGWGWDEYLQTPDTHVAVIRQLMAEEAEEIERLRASQGR